MIAYAGIGYTWLLFGRKFHSVIILGALFIAGNFVCETLLDFLNTTDIVDAIYGTVGVLAVFIYLFFLNKYGLVERPPEKG